MTNADDCSAYHRTSQISTDMTTHDLTNWILMPKGRFYKDFRAIRFQTGKPQTAEPVMLDAQYMSKGPSVLAYKLVGLHPGYEHETVWSYR